MNGEWTEKQVKLEFLKNFDAGNKDGTVSVTDITFFDFEKVVIQISVHCWEILICFYGQ